MAPPHPYNLAIHVEKQGPKRIGKDTFPIRYGKYSEIRTSDFVFQFNLNGEIKSISGLNTNWPHPAEQLKRTDGNDWVYYSVGDDSSDKGLISWLGEYYLPCLPYPSNPIWEVDFFSNPIIMNAFAAWPQLYANLHGAMNDQHQLKTKALINSIIKNDEHTLHQRSKKMQSIIGGRLSVLPPDTRHVDYEIIPLNIADGCLYHCKFCSVKSAQRFKVRSENSIITQIQQLKAFYGRNIENYQALYLGNHDALAAGDEVIGVAASEAYKNFRFGAGTEHAPFLFVFGSVDSLLKSKDSLFEKLNRLPFYTYINIGIESADPTTLDIIGKPISEYKVHEAFHKMLDINDTYKHIEVTANFVIGNGLPAQHYTSLKELLGNANVSAYGKGAIYLSPLKESPKKRELLPLVYEIKKSSKIPVYIYLIQRL